jgi:hypothetical protein
VSALPAAVGPVFVDVLLREEIGVVCLSGVLRGAVVVDAKIH